MEIRPATDSDYSEAALAYEELISALDHALLYPQEIRKIAEAVNALPEGRSFWIALLLEAPPPQVTAVAVIYD